MEESGPLTTKVPYCLNSIGYLSTLGRHPEAQIPPGHETHLGIEAGYRTEDNHGHGDQYPLQQMHEAVEASVLAGTLGYQLHGYRGGYDQPEKRCGEESLRDERQIVRENGGVECAPSDDERQPPDGKED